VQRSASAPLATRAGEGRAKQSHSRGAFLRPSVANNGTNPFASKQKGRQSADRRSHPLTAFRRQVYASSANHLPCGYGPSVARSPLGALPRRSPEARRPIGSTPGHASWDADLAGVTSLRLSQSRESTSRTGRSTGVNDARSRPGAECKSARRNRTRSAFRCASRTRPLVSEIRLCNLEKDGSQGKCLQCQLATIAPNDSRSSVCGDIPFIRRELPCGYERRA
jgi:hypothetical protein